MKISYSEYVKKTDVSVLVAEAIFSQLITEYPCQKMSDVSDSTSGGTPLRGNDDFYNGNIPWLKSGELNDGLIEKAEEYITEKGLKNSSAKLLPKGTLLLAMYGATAGRTGITKIEASTNQAVCALFPNEQVTKEYLFWFLRQHRYKFIEISKGGAQPNLSQSVIKETKLPVPGKNLQKKIAELLYKIEIEKKLDISTIPKEFREKVNSIFYTKNLVFEGAAELTHQQDLLKQLRQSFLREAMQGKLVKQNTKDGNAADLLKKIKADKEKLVAEKKLKKEKELPPIKEEEIPFPIPENWVWCRLGEICNYGSSPKAEPKYLTENTWVLDLEDIEKETSILLCKIRFRERNSLSTKSVFKEGEVLYSKLRPYLDKVIVADEDGVCTTEILPLKFHGEINPYFLRYALKRSDFLSYVNSVTKGMKMPRLGTNEGQMALIPLPPLPEQKRIVNKLEELMKYCDELKTTISNNQHYTDMLLQVALKEALQPKEVVTENQ